MSVSLRENITAVIETCFSETKDEIQEVAINRILELIRADRKTENCSEKPNNCETCRYNSDEWDSPKCDGCSKAHSNYEPQTDVYEYQNGEWVKPDCPWK